MTTTSTPTPGRSPVRSPVRRAVERATPALLLAGLAVVAAGHVTGVRAVPVLTGSMTPYAPAGSLVLTTPVTGEAVEVGDVVAFVPPSPFGTGSLPVMHRVAGTGTSGGVPSMTTKGDANPQPDPWTVALPGADLGRAVAVVPLLGRAVMGGPVAGASLLGGALALTGAVRLTRRRPPCDCPAGPPVTTTAAPTA